MKIVSNEDYLKICLYDKLLKKHCKLKEEKYTQYYLDLDERIMELRQKYCEDLQSHIESDEKYNKKLENQVKTQRDLITKLYLKIDKLQKVLK